ncbi:MAG: hypothetical protein KUG73_14130 [Pseudomonadales bacterium]|nr:hypothetical protein [Pseudomonadales bacterium]
MTEKAVSPIGRYQLDLSKAGFSFDETQAAAVTVLQLTYKQLMEESNTRTIHSLFTSKASISSRLQRPFKTSSQEYRQTSKGTLS